MAKKRYFLTFLRHPRTTQEIRANLDKYDPLIRKRRRKLPTAWDDQYIHPQKSWKYLRRNKQYRENGNGYSWHEVHYKYNERQVTYKIVYLLQKLGCYYEWLNGGGIRWYGPEI